MAGFLERMFDKKISNTTDYDELIERFRYEYRKNRGRPEYKKNNRRFEAIKNRIADLLKKEELSQITDMAKFEELWWKINKELGLQLGDAQVGYTRTELTNNSPGAELRKIIEGRLTEFIKDNLSKINDMEELLYCWSKVPSESDPDKRIALKIDELLGKSEDVSELSSWWRELKAETDGKGYAIEELIDARIVELLRKELPQINDMEKLLYLSDEVPPATYDNFGTAHELIEDRINFLKPKRIRSKRHNKKKTKVNAKEKKPEKKKDKPDEITKIGRL